MGSQSTRYDVARHADTPKLSPTTRTIHRHGALTLDAVQLAQAETLVPLRSTAAAHMFALSGRASKPRGGPRWPLFRPCKVMAQHASRHSSRGGRGDRLLLLLNRLLLLLNVLYCTPVLHVLLHVLRLYFNVLYIVAYSTYFRCILLYSMYSAEGECTPMYLGVLCCVSGVHVLHPYSECTPVVLCRLR